MKKYLIRIIGALCILASVLVMFTTTWVKMDEVSRSDLRTFRNTVSNDMATVKNIMETGIQKQSFKEELKDADLPYTKSKIKNRIDEVEDLFKEAINTELSIQEVTTLSFAIPQIIKDTRNFLDTPTAAKAVFENTNQLNMADTDELISTVEDYASLIPLLGWFFVLIIILGVLGAVAHCLNKGRYVKYFYIVLLAVLVIGLLVALPLVSVVVQEEASLTSGADEIAFVATAMPVISLVLAFVPVVLDIIFERKKKAI